MKRRITREHFLGEQESSWSAAGMIAGVVLALILGWVAVGMVLG